MALNCNKLLPDGVTIAGYWRISQFRVDVLQLLAEIRVVGYINQVSRLNGDNPITDTTVITKIQVGFTNVMKLGGVFPALYTACQNDSQFYGAVQVSDPSEP